MKTLRFFRLLLVLFLAVRFAAADEPALRAGLLEPAAVLAAAADVTRERFPDADSVWIRSSQVTTYAPDGTSTDFYDAWAKILTEKGRRDLQTFRFGFNTVYGGVEVIRVSIHKPDGTAVDVDVARHSREMVAPGQMNQNIYDPHQRLLQVGVPGLEIGDVVRLVGRQTTTRARMADTWSDFTTFEGESPVLEETYEVRAPRARPLVHRRLRDEVAGTVAYESEETADGTIHRWRARNVPRMFEEPNMPEAHTVVQRLLLSTIPDWPTVSRWYWELSRPRLESVSDEMRAKVRELTEGKDDADARLRALFFFVAQNVQYLGITTETVAPGYEPSDVDATFAKRSGVCRDKAALLVAMLRLAGFEAFPVLISVGPLMDAEVPLPYFNHAIVAVRRPDGSFELMDPTDETTQELFPAHLNHRSYLVATPEGEPLRVSPVIPAEQNLVEIETAARLAADGTVTGASTLRFRGLNDNAYRGYFSSIKPEERRRFFEGLIKRVLPGATLTGFTLSPDNLLDMATKLEARLEFTAADAMIAGGGVALPPAPWFGPSVGMVNFVLGQTGLAKRRYPLVTETACGVRERFELDVSAALGAPLSLPVPPDLSDRNLVWRQSLAHDAATGRLTGSAEFRLETVEFAPAEYLELKATLERIASERRKRPIFRIAGGAAAAGPAAAAAVPGAAEADVELLEHSTDYALASGTEWTVTETVRKKVLTFAAIRPHSVIKIPYNTGWETVEVGYARVTTPAGQVLEAPPSNINLMDAPWVSAAPRYPATKILTVSLPGVEVGATIEYRIVRRLKDRVFFTAAETFGGHEPTAARTVRITAPAGLPMQFLAGDGVPPAGVVETGGPDTGRSWTAERLAAIPREDAQPPVWALAPTLFVSHPEGPAAYAKAVDAVLRAAAAESAEVAAVARTLAAAHPDRAARLRAIRDAVARRIRRAGPALSEAPLSAVSAADVAWREGYGTSADEAVVLAAMLAAAGEKPSFVLPASVRPVDAATRRPLEAFQPGLFPGVLVRVPFEDGWLYLNDTDQYAALGATPSEGSPGLVTDTGAIETIEPPAAWAAGSETRFDLAVEADGGARLRVTRIHRGPAHGAGARLYAEMSPEERRRHHQELVGEVSSDAVADGELTADFAAYPGRESFAVRIPRYAVRDDPFLYLTLPAADGGLPRVRSDARRTPLYWDAVARSKTLVTVTTPAGFAEAVLAPSDFEWNSEGGGTLVRVSREGATLSVLRVARWTPAVFAPEAYPGLLEAHRRLTHPRGRFLLLRAGTGAAPANR